MLLTQKFHSLAEIDPEFVSSLELLLHEEWPDFQAWLENEKLSPAEDTYTYWLFFGPTQNAPVGVAQLCLKKLDGSLHQPWWKRAAGVFGVKPDDVRLAVWSLASGGDGPALFDPRFAKSGREKLIGLVKETGAREDVMAISVALPSGWTAPPRPDWENMPPERRESWQSLRPLERRHKTYQDYLAGLAPDAANEIQRRWKRLHKDSGVSLGDYATPASRAELLKECPQAPADVIDALPGGLLTFQKNGELLGLVHYLEGQANTWFFEPLPLEAQGDETVEDQTYVQYAILKWHEMQGARKLVITRQARPLRLSGPDEALFFTSQGFPVREVEEIHWARDAHWA